MVYFPPLMLSLLPSPKASFSFTLVRATRLPRDPCFKLWWPGLVVGRQPPALPWPDIGHLAKWSVSSFKFGFGPECLQDDDPDTFWQLSREQYTRALAPLTRFSLSSDGPQPHFITVEFPRKMAVQVLINMNAARLCS